MMRGKVRIIGGEWRGRKLAVPEKQGLRPTPDRVRETLFNWLNWQVPASRCLDLFAGTGALGVEAASRGAKQVILVEKDRSIAEGLRQQLAPFASEKVQVIQADALQWLSTPPAEGFDIVFLDPPFQQNLLAPCCELLESKGWLAPNAFIYLEAEAELQALILPKNWTVIKQQRAGQVAAYLVQRTVNLA
ncbi:MAG: 16S rRNA (guanine(966)-N(2))-methyltransferase RsmD [Thiotrichaceae bacterium]|nr:16S rRNA (guanine(966)-N(2))-methyltransferase RsmD [Thiotrichaceae bacterium]